MLLKERSLSKERKDKQMANRTIAMLSNELNVIVTQICDSITGRSNATTQLLRACTSIGANKAEAKYGESRADFIHKMEIALKECSETAYWLDYLYSINEIDTAIYKRAKSICGSIERKLVASVRTAKGKK